VKGSGADPAARGLSGLGVSSVVCGLCSYFFLLSAFFGIALGVLGLMRNRRDVLCLIGTILSVVFLISGIVSMVRLCGSPGMESMLSGSM